MPQRSNRQRRQATKTWRRVYLEPCSVVNNFAAKTTAAYLAYPGDWSMVTGALHNWKNGRKVIPDGVHNTYVMCLLLIAELIGTCVLYNVSCISPQRALKCILNMWTAEVLRALSRCASISYCLSSHVTCWQPDWNCQPYQSLLYITLLVSLFSGLSSPHHEATKHVVLANGHLPYLFQESGFCWKHRLQKARAMSQLQWVMGSDLHRLIQLGIAHTTR